MGQSLIPMLLLGPTFLLAYATSRAGEAADASPQGPTAPRRPPPTFTACDPTVAASVPATL
jgi:hypothetical protein